MNMAFDIHGTLLRSNEKETEVMAGLLKILKNAGHTIIVWSGEDLDEIIKIVRDLEIEEYVDKVMTKINFDRNYMTEIAFDDNPAAFAVKAVIQV